jgi:hypothetical protein
MADAQENLEAPLPKVKRARRTKIEIEKAVVIQPDLPQETVKSGKKTKEELALEQQFDPQKKYMFEATWIVPERELPEMTIVNRRATPSPLRKHRPFQNIIFTSQVIWNGQRRIVRYYDGCTSIFADEQPKEDKVLDQLMKQTQQRNLVEGKFGCFGDERMLLLYLFICSWNAHSEFRTRTAYEVFIPVNPDKTSLVESSKLDETETALKLAKEASETKMLIHANYLGIPTKDYDTDNDLTPDQIRTQYRKFSLRESTKFIESYGNKSIEIKYYIDKALEKGLISNKFNPNKFTWAKSNSEICDSAGIKSLEGQAQKLFEHSQLEAGEEFAIQLRALFE